MVKLKDHRQIGKELDLFSFHDVAPGAVFWHPRGLIIFRELQKFIREKIEAKGYQEIATPVMVKSRLFQQSGHWQHFGQHNMFNLKIDDELWTLKPMNCPESTLIYSSRTRSYNDLPLRLSDFGILHRKELSGVLGGLLRVQQMMQDDAHLYVRPDQIQQEIHTLIQLVKSIYASLKFVPHFYFSTKPEKAMGDPKLWQEAEEDLEIALREAKVKYDVKTKDGAFYGPKIDIHIKDSQDRDWQLATIQLDFQIPERMKLAYIDKDGGEKRPVMIHRAIFGSFERFIGILIEHYQGAFPLWLSPVQVAILPVSDKFIKNAQEIHQLLRNNHIRSEAYVDNKTVGAKIREATLQKIPYMIIIGKKEVQDKEKKFFVSVRTREGEDLGRLPFYEFLKDIKEKIENRL